MFAVILAGGAGTRLRPLTYARRKELVPILGKPLLEYRLTNLREHGVEDVVLACSQGAQEIEQHFGDGSDLGVRLTYAYEGRPLGSGRAVKEAARSAGSTGTLVVCNGDILTNVELTAMLEQHRETGAALSMSLAPVDDPWNYGVVEVDEDLRIRRFVEKPPQGEEPSRLINAGTWLWEPEVLERIPDDETAVRDGFSERVLFPGIIDDGLRAQGFVEDLWVDVGSPERYLRANRLMLERVAHRMELDVIGIEGSSVASDALLTGMVYIAEGAEVGAEARVTGPAVLGPRTRVGAGASVEESVLWEDASVGDGASVSGCIIGAGATVGAGATLRDAVLADGAEVASRAEPEAGVRVMPGERV
jgi:mannose-1-phosphate guanylyltransferase